MENKNISTGFAVSEAAAKPNYISEIADLIRSNDSPKALMSKLDDYHANDIADVITEFDLTERKKFYRVCSLDMLAEIFEYLDNESAVPYLEEMGIKKQQQSYQSLIQTQQLIFCGVLKKRNACL